MNDDKNPAEEMFGDDYWERRDSDEIFTVADGWEFKAVPEDVDDTKDHLLTYLDLGLVVFFDTVDISRNRASFNGDEETVGIALDPLPEEIAHQLRKLALTI